MEGRLSQSPKLIRTLAGRFTEGEEVEVATKEEAFAGSWYVATIIHPSKRKKTLFYIVEYKTLTEQTEAKPLREFIPGSNIRPLPPSEDSPIFEPKEDVDAYFHDGWWKGVVIKVLEENRYVVYLESTKEQKEFGVSDLRTCLDWIAGKWLKSQRREISYIQNSQGGLESTIRTGSTAVTSEMVNRPSPSEDSLKRKSPSSPLRSYQMMTPASTNKPALKIKLTTSRTSAEDSQPCKKLREDVERKNSMPMKACHMRGASSGNFIDLDITLVPRRKRSKRPQSKGRVNSFSLAKNYIKDDDVSSSRHNGKGNDDQESEVVHIAEHIVPSSRERGRPRKSVSYIKRSAKGNEQKTPGRGRGRGWGRPRKLVSTFSSKRDQLHATNPSSKTSETGVEHKKGQGIPKAPAPSIDLLTVGLEDEEACGRQIADSISRAECAVSNHYEEDHVPLSNFFKKFVSPIGENSGISPENQCKQNEVTTVGDELLDSVEFQNSLAFVDQILLDECYNAREDEQNGTTITSSDATRQGNYGHLPQSLPSIPINSAKKQSMSIGESRRVSPKKTIMPCDASAMEDAPMETHGQQNALVIVDKHTVLGESSPTSPGEQNETAILPFVVDATTNERDVPRSSPFVKSPLLSPFLKGVGSMCRFSSISQQPHFRGLELFNEELQEGLALGYMASYGSVLEKIHTATLDEPQGSFEKKLSALNYLEGLGFTVQHIRNRLQELLKIKENHGHLEDVLKEVERKIITESDKNGRLAVQIDELQKTINEVNKRMQCVMVQMEMKGSEVTELERKQDEIRQNIQEAKHDYDCVRAAPCELIMDGKGDPSDQNTTGKVKRFNGKNFPCWKMQMKDYKYHKELYKPLGGKDKMKDVMTSEEYEFLDRKALGQIRMTLREDNVPSSRKRGRPKKSDSSITRSAKGNEQKISGRGQGRQRKQVSTLPSKSGLLQATNSSSKTSETGVEHKKSRGRPKVLDSSIDLLAKGPKDEEACGRQTVDSISMANSAVSNHCDEYHVPLSELFKKFISPTGENSENQYKPDRAITEENELLSPIELETSLAFVDQILLDEVNNAREDEQNGRTLTSSDATRQGDYGPLLQSLRTIPLNSAEALNHNAEKQSMLLAESYSSPTGERRGISPEKPIMPYEAFPMDDPSMEIHGQQSALLTVGKPIVLATTSRGEQNETAILPSVINATKNATLSHPSQGNKGNIPRRSPFVKSSMLSPLWKVKYLMSKFQ